MFVDLMKEQISPLTLLGFICKIGGVKLSKTSFSQQWTSHDKWPCTRSAKQSSVAAVRKRPKSCLLSLPDPFFGDFQGNQIIWVFLLLSFSFFTLVCVCFAQDQTHSLTHANMPTTELSH
jgi:hypothetical protein